MERESVLCSLSMFCSRGEGWLVVRPVEGVTGLVAGMLESHFPSQTPELRTPLTVGDHLDRVSQPWALPSVGPGHQQNFPKSQSGDLDGLVPAHREGISNRFPLSHTP